MPNCEHVDPCPVCAGSGTRPTDAQIAELRLERDRLAGDLMVADAELAAYKERGEAHPFDQIITGGDQ